MDTFHDDISAMQYALHIAAWGTGMVEPNPAVGAVIVSADGAKIAEGWHQKFGDAHAEINAIREAQGRTQGADLFVTLEPCGHHGKTPPCAEAVVVAGFRRVVIGCQDPAPHVAGQGIRKLRDAGIDVVVGVCEEEARRLISPFEMLVCHARPWVVAKWAMTLDGRIATTTGHSQWISNEQSRAEVHRLRGHMDAILTGAGTVRADNPTLIARPAGPRMATRVILDSLGTSVVTDGQLARTIEQAPVLIFVTERATADAVRALENIGCEVCLTPTDSAGHPSVAAVLQQLGQRQFTNVLVEGGSQVLGSFFDCQLVDEAHVFIAPKIVGGAAALSPVGGAGLDRIPELASLSRVRSTMYGSDMCIRGDVVRRPGGTTC